MKLGMLTACLPQLALDEIAAWAAGAGYDALEVAVWPSTGGRDFEAAHLDVANFGPRRAEQTRQLFDRHGLTLSALAYYENNLHPDPARRAGIRAEAEPIFREIVDYAGERDVKIIIENCVMEGWHPDGYPGNLAYSPELWEWMFSLGLYLNWDPSHLIWLGVDPAPTIAPYADRIVHAQAKDAQILPGRVDRYGFFGKAAGRKDPWDNGWWRYRVPGRGQVDWGAVVDALYENGFTGTLSVEHEDPVWSGDETRVKQGLEIAYRTLRPLIVG
jgi:sugar phosphate isomerase/epimerase